MAKVEIIEPTQLPNGLWLGGNEYASENVEESAGVLSLETGETDGCRVSEELDVGAISNVASSKLEWTSSGDVEVLAAVSETSAKGSISFDGVDDYVDTGFSVQYTTGDSFTYNVWFKTTQSTRGELLDIRDFSKAGFPVILISINNDSEIQFVLRGDDNKLVRVDFNDYSVNDNEWHMATLTVNNGILSSYVDGNFNNSTSGVDMNINLSDTTLKLGSADNLNVYFDGYLNNAYVYNKALTSQEVTDLYNNIYITDGLVAHYPLDDTDSTARDISGNNNNGTIIGASYSPDNPLLQAAINGQAIPGVSPGDDLTGKKLYMQQRLSRAVGTDPSPTLTELTATVSGEVISGALPLINGGLIRSAHTQNNTMIR